MSIQHEQVAECRRMLRTAYNERAVQSLLKLAQINLEVIKSKLLTAAADDVRELQGEGQAWALLLKYIENDPVTTD
jgi:hypothetical protein